MNVYSKLIWFILKVVFYSLKALAHSRDYAFGYTDSASITPTKHLITRYKIAATCSALKRLIWTPPIAQYPSLILSDCVLICGLIMRSYLGPLMYSRPCASSPTRCFNTPGTLQAIKGGSNRLTQVLGQYCCFCY